MRHRYGVKSNVKYWSVCLLSRLNLVLNQKKCNMLCGLHFFLPSGDKACRPSCTTPLGTKRVQGLAQLGPGPQRKERSSGGLMPPKGKNVTLRGRNQSSVRPRRRYERDLEPVGSVPPCLPAGFQSLLFAAWSLVPLAARQEGSRRERRHVRER